MTNVFHMILFPYDWGRQKVWTLARLIVGDALNDQAITFPISLDSVVLRW